MAASADEATLSRIENRLFLKTYEGETDDVRVGRIEKQVFGSPAEGSLHQRLERIEGAVAPQENPDGTVSGMRPKPAPQAVQTPVEQSSSSRQNYQPDDQSSGLERAQLAVQAAREERINRLLDEGVKLWRAKQGNQAIEKFEGVLRLDPGNAQANFSMGIIYESAGNFIEAQSCYKRAQEQSPGNKDYADAVAAISHKVSDKTNKQDKQGKLRILAEDANAAYGRGEFVSALGLYKQMDQLVPNQALVKYNIGTCYMAVKNPVDALEYYKQARKLKPNEPRYATACEKLEANLSAARKKREEAESAWAQPPQKEWQDKSHKKKAGVDSLALTQGQRDPMAMIGLIGRTSKQGVEITAVGLASRAARVGLINGDIIKAVDGKIVKSVDQINKILLKTDFQSPVQMTVQRGANMGQVSF